MIKSKEENKKIKEYCNKRMISIIKKKYKEL